MICPACNGTDALYAAFSGGREMFCPDCGEHSEIPDDEPDPPRAILLRTAEGRIALRAQMDQELARRREGQYE